MANERPNGNFFGESVLMGSGTEREYQRIVNERRNDEAKPGIDTVSGFFTKHNLHTHESSMLFAVAGDKESLKKFANDKKDKFFSKNFRDACKGVLRKVHGINYRTKKVPQIAAKI